MKKKVQRMGCPDCKNTGYRMSNHADATYECPTGKGKKTLHPDFAALVIIRRTAEQLIENTNKKDR